MLTQAGVCGIPPGGIPHASENPKEPWKATGPKWSSGSPRTTQKICFWIKKHGKVKIKVEIIIEIKIEIKINKIEIKIKNSN